MRRLVTVLLVVALTGCAAEPYVPNQDDLRAIGVLREWQANHPPSFLDDLDDSELAELGRRTCQMLTDGGSVSEYMRAAGMGYGEEGLPAAWAVIAAASLFQCPEHFHLVEAAFDLMRRGGGVGALYK